MPAPPPTRRAVLRTAGAGAVLALAACRSTPPPAALPPPVDPDDAVRLRSADAERALLQAYDAALAADPASAARLAPVRAEHAEHLAALGGETGPAPRLTTGDLSAAERSAAAVHGRGVRDARQPGLAQLLGSLAASEASHVVVLTAAPA